MNLRQHKVELPTLRRRSAAGSQCGSVLIIVLWIMFGLIAITLYFAHSMSFELHASDNRAAGVEAEQAIEGARRYLTCVLSNLNSTGVLPDTSTYENAAVPVGNAHFWLIGRGDDTLTPVTAPHFGLIDEASKINLNSATSNVLINLPRMTPDLVANIIAWRKTNTTSLSGAAESDTYQMLQPPYLAKNSPYETVDELRLVYNMDMDILYGEDANLNGALDPNENDGDALPPSDNMNGTLDPGLLEYCTVYSIDSANDSNGTPRVNLSTATQTALLNAFTTNGISSSRATQIITASGIGGGRTYSNLLQFYYASGMTTTEFPKVEGSLRGTTLVGLINVNTASQAVLACIPGLTNGQAAQLVQYRQQNTNTISQTPASMIWVTQVLQQTDALAAAPYITGRGYQYMADVAALGHEGRGYRRTRFIFDTSQGTPVILHRQDLSNLGWALGKDVRDKWLLGKQIQ